METKPVADYGDAMAAPPPIDGPHAPKVAPEADLMAFAHTLHEYLRQNIANADTKAAFIFAAASGALAYLNNAGMAKRLLPAADIALTPWAATSGALSLVTLIVAVAMAIATVWPRTGGSGSGIVFWRAIATRKSADAYAREVRARTSVQLVTEKLEHCWELASVCERKFGLVKIAIYSATIGFVAALAYLVLAS